MTPTDTLIRNDPPAVIADLPVAPGVPPLSPESLDNQFGYAVGSLPDDAHRALRWLRRGRLVSTALLPMFIRRFLLQLGGVRIGRSVCGLERVTFQSTRVTIGDGCGIGAECFIEGNGRVEIGDNCLLGPQVMIVTSIHPVGSHGEVARRCEYRDVTIGEGTWLGSRVTVMPGVQIGPGLIVASGSVVTKHIEGPGAVFGGVPAKRIKSSSENSRVRLASAGSSVARTQGRRNSSAIPSPEDAATRKSAAARRARGFTDELQVSRS